MKKILALVLALCMALAAIPALAEEDFTGTWYLLMFGMTGATFDLNADGTFTATPSISADTTEAAEGTWSAEGSTVTLTVDEQALPLTYDGTNLQLGEEALSAFGGDLASTGLDVSMLASMISMSREPGSVTMAEFTAYQTDGTLPEGKTKEDMDAIYAEMMMLVFSIAGSMDIGDTTATGTDPSADSTEAFELTILEDNFYIDESYSGLRGNYIAKVQNNTDTTFSVNKGILVLKDADGNEVGRREYLGQCGSTYLEPGEISYISIDANINEGATVADYEMSFETSLPKSYMPSDIPLDAENVELRISEGYWTNYDAAGTVTNTGDTPLSRIYIVFVLRSSDGKLVGLSSTGLGQNELAPGSTITLVDSISSSIVEYCTANDLTLSEEVEALAYSEIY